MACDAPLGRFKVIIRSMKEKKKAVVDIDNTLWHFCDVLYERLKSINGAMPPPDDWTDWDFWENYCSKEEFVDAIQYIQMNQDDDRHLPYPEARDFLSTLKKHNFHIIIASHRTPESIKQTHRWLVKHSLAFDEVHLSYDKTVLFDGSCDIVVDDSPHVLEKAVEKGILATGLVFPWNQNSANNGCRLFGNLKEILEHILVVGS
jgi:5'(3')-deoxyribonucleotidase